MDKPENAVEIDLTEPVSLTFSLKYLTNFCKASGLSDTVKLCLSSEVPLLVEYGLANNSYLRFYLAPKVCHMCRFVSKAMTNVDRSATRSNCVTTYVGTSNMFPRIMWGDHRRNAFDMHSQRQLFSLQVKRVGSAKEVHSEVFRTAVAKARVPRPCPTLLFRVIARGASDKEINTVHYQPFAPCLLLFHAFPVVHTDSCLLQRDMASDPLIPDTRVLAIASHVRAHARSYIQPNRQLIRGR